MRMLLSLLLEWSRQDGIDGALVMVWRSSYLKRWRGGLVCFTCSSATSWGGFWTLSQLDRIYAAILYHTSCHKTWLWDHRSSEATLTLTLAKVISVGFVNLYKNKVDWSRVSACSNIKSRLKNSADEYKHKDELQFACLTFQEESVKQTHVMWRRVLLLPGWLLQLIIDFPACSSIKDAFVCSGSDSDSYLCFSDTRTY